MDASILILAGLGVATAVVSFIAAYQWRGKAVPLDWLFFVAFGFGALSIALMYADIVYIAYYGKSKQFLLPILRVVFGFVLVVTFLASTSVLVRKGNNN